MPIVFTKKNGVCDLHYQFHEQMSCTKKFISFILNEKRVCRMLGVDPAILDEQGNNEIQKQQYILQTNNIITPLKLISDNKQLQLQFICNYNCVITLILDPIKNENNGYESNFIAPPQKYNSNKQIQQYQCQFPKENAQQAVILVTLQNKNQIDNILNKVTFSIFKIDLNKQEFTEQVVKVNDQFYKLEKIFGIDNDERGCVICMTQDVQIVAMPCRHLILCRECAEQFRNKENECPLCRKKIEYLIDMGDTFIHSQSQRTQSDDIKSTISVK